MGLGVHILKEMRPKQWTKNILLLGGLYFPHAAGRDPLFLHSEALLRAVGGFLVFCALTSSIYILNDIIDAPKDRLHPRKRKRPIASGELSPRVAGAVGAILCAASMAGAWRLSPAFFLCASAYLAKNVAYSLMLKEVFLIDTMIISMGFIIRAVSGVIVLRTPEQYVELTPWFAICVLFLSLFLAFCKRRSEIAVLEENAASHRKVLQEYSGPLLDMGIGVSATAAILAYALYATNHPNPWMMLTTLPFVLYGIFRYIFHVYSLKEGDAPEEVLLGDTTLMGCIVLWAMALALVFYPT